MRDEGGAVAYTRGMDTACEMPASNPADPEIRTLLEHSRTIAVVGLSDKPDRDSYRVAEYMRRAGYQVIPVNPNVTHVFGERSYQSVRDLPGPVDIVCIFRKPEAVPEIVDDAVAIRAKAVWMQLGIAHNRAAETARAAGLQVVMSRCIKIEHARLL